MIISADDISNYFRGTSREAQGIFPELISRLIFAQNTEQIKFARFPVGDQIRQPGFDGYVVWDGKLPWIPKGKSVWEFGCNENPKEKANKDWIAADSRKWPKKVQRQQVYTWVFVTPHTWTTQDRNIWIEAKKEESKWKDIVILDATDLESWLAFCPVVCRWLGQIIGKQVKGMYTLEEQLSYFLPKYQSLEEKAKLIIGGRAENVDTFVQWITSSKTILDIYGESRQEVIWFVAAAAILLSPHKHHSLSTKLVYVESPDAVEAISHSISEVIIVPLTEEAESKALSLANRKCRIICPKIQKMISLIPPQNSILKLTQVHVAAIQSALQSLGISERNASNFARESKGSLHAVIWALDENSDSVSQLCNNNNIIIYASLWLAGQWDDENDNDKGLIETMAGKPWTDIEPIVASELSLGKHFEQFGRIMDWKAWPIHLECLRAAFSTALLTRYKDAIIKVFSQIDPKVKISGQDRLLADLNNIKHPYSVGIRNGLLSSLAMLGVHLPNRHNFVNQIVEELLSGQGELLGTKWATIANGLGDLAEAAPGGFIAACRVLVKDKEACECIFINDDDIFSARAFHCNLLWALERLAWSPEYFFDIVDILACFEELKLETKISNTPINSLFEIFLPWHVSTLADYSLRKKTFLELSQKHQEVGRDLARKLIPSPHSFASGTQKPKWHDWLEAGIPAGGRTEYIDFTKFIVAWMIESAVKMPQYWHELIDRFTDWGDFCGPEIKEKFFDSLNSIDVAKLKLEDRKAIHEEMLSLISENIQYSDAKWAMNADQLKPFEDLAKKFELKDILRQNLWLFDPWPKFIMKKMTHQEREKYVDEKRINAIKEIYQVSGIEPILDITIVEPGKAWHLGYSLAKINITEEDENKVLLHGLRIPLVEIGKEQSDNFTRGYAIGKIYPISPNNSWIKEILDRPLGWDVTMYANLSLLLPAMQESWDWIESKGDEVKGIYWQNVNYNVLVDPDSDLEKAVSELLRVSRPCMAIDTIAMAIHGNPKHLNISPDLIEKAVQNAAYEGSDILKVNTQMLPYNIDKILEYLESIGKTDKELVQLEFLWMNALEHSERGTKSLQKCLSTEPGSFIEVLKAVFKPESAKDEEEELNERDRQHARMCFNLLYNWTTCPATKYTDDIKNINRTNEDNSNHIPFRRGTINEEELNHYFTVARESAAAIERLSICDSQLGEILAYSPLGEDNAWPAEEVCRLLELISSDRLDNGIVAGIYNKRGAYVVAPHGSGELAIAAQFNSYLDARDCYPRTRKILTNLVKDFKAEAKSQQERERFDEFER